MADMFGYLKRRFSSGDLQGELADKREQEGLPSFLKFGGSTTSNTPMRPQQPGQATTGPAHPNMSQRGGMPGQRYQSQTHHTAEFGSGHQPAGFQPPSRLQQQQQVGQAAPGAGSVPHKVPFPSAPTSPTRSYGGSASQHPGGSGSFMNNVGGLTRGLFSAASSAASQVRDKAAMVGQVSGLGRDRCKVVLVVDEPSTDWSKCFRGRRVGDCDLRVEQAQLSEISITAHTDQGCVCTITPTASNHQMTAIGALSAGGAQRTRSFRPDFVVFRQLESGKQADAVLDGLAYANTPSLNSMQAVRAMQHRSWVMGQLISICNALGRDQFPLIVQSYHSCPRELSNAPAFPAVMKVGEAHFGDGKVRVDNQQAFQDISSLIGLTGTHVTIEPFIDAKCHMQLQKIGNRYKAFMRKSISGSWKSNVGASMLEKVAVTEKYKLWLDETSRIFGGLDVCALEIVQSKTGEHFIYGARGSDVPLLGDGQEEDKRDIAELVVNRILGTGSGSLIKPSTSITTNIHAVGDQTPAQPPPAVPLRPQNSMQAGEVTGHQPPSASTHTAVGRSVNPPSSVYSAGQHDSPARPPPGQPISNAYTGAASSTPTSTVRASPFSQMPNTAASNAPVSSTAAATTTAAAVPPAPAAMPSAYQMQHRHEDSSARSSVKSGSEYNRQNSTTSTISEPTRAMPQGTAASGTEDNEDTMKNLRKTFAGIFGDM